MCSFSMPKCVEGVERPIPPCRSVCLEFVGSCQSLLSVASHAGLFRALCDLLPEQDSWPNTCFVPDGFKRTLPTGRSICSGYRVLDILSIKVPVRKTASGKA